MNEDRVILLCKECQLEIQQAETELHTALMKIENAKTSLEAMQKHLEKEDK